MDIFRGSMQLDMQLIVYPADSGQLCGFRKGDIQRISIVQNLQVFCGFLVS